MKTVTTFISVILLSIFLGCGGGNSNTKIGITAQLVDSPIAGITYICQDGTSGLTDSNGMFTCNTTPVKFQIGNLQLGIINTIPSDSKIFPQDLLGLKRDAYGNPKLIALTRLLQSMDSDGNISKTITIPSEMADKFTNCYSEIESFYLNTNDDIDDKLDEYATCAEITLVDGEDAIKHLQEYYNAHDSNITSSSSSTSGGVNSESNSTQEETNSTNNNQESNLSSNENPLWKFHATYTSSARGSGSMTIKKFTMDIDKINESLPGAPGVPAYIVHVGNDYQSYPENTTISYSGLAYNPDLAPLLVTSDGVDWHALTSDEPFWMVGSYSGSSDMDCSGILPADFESKVKAGESISWTSGKYGTSCSFLFEPCQNEACD